MNNMNSTSKILFSTLTAAACCTGFAFTYASNLPTVQASPDVYAFVETRESSSDPDNSITFRLKKVVTDESGKITSYEYGNYAARADLGLGLSEFERRRVELAITQQNLYVHSFLDNSNYRTAGDVLLAEGVDWEPNHSRLEQLREQLDAGLEIDFGQLAKRFYFWAESRDECRSLDVTCMYKSGIDLSTASFERMPRKFTIKNFQLSSYFGDHSKKGFRSLMQNRYLFRYVNLDYSKDMEVILHDSIGNVAITTRTNINIKARGLQGDIYLGHSSGFLSRKGLKTRLVQLNFVSYPMAAETETVFIRSNLYVTDARSSEQIAAGTMQGLLKMNVKFNGFSAWYGNMKIADTVKAEVRIIDRDGLGPKFLNIQENWNINHSLEFAQSKRIGGQVGSQFIVSSERSHDRSYLPRITVNNDFIIGANTEVTINIPFTVGDEGKLIFELSDERYSSGRLQVALLEGRSFTLPHADSVEVKLASNVRWEDVIELLSDGSYIDLIQVTYGGLRIDGFDAKRESILVGDGAAEIVLYSPSGYSRPTMLGVRLVKEETGRRKEVEEVSGETASQRIPQDDTSAYVDDEREDVGLTDDEARKLKDAQASAAQEEQSSGSMMPVTDSDDRVATEVEDSTSETTSSEGDSVSQSGEQQKFVQHLERDPVTSYVEGSRFWVESDNSASSDASREDVDQPEFSQLYTLNPSTSRLELSEYWLRNGGTSASSDASQEDVDVSPAEERQNFVQLLERDPVASYWKASGFWAKSDDVDSSDASQEDVDQPEFIQLYTRNPSTLRLEPSEYWIRKEGTSDSNILYLYQVRDASATSGAEGSASGVTLTEVPSADAGNGALAAVNTDLGMKAFALFNGVWSSLPSTQGTGDFTINGDVGASFYTGSALKGKVMSAAVSGGYRWNDIAINLGAQYAHSIFGKEKQHFVSSVVAVSYYKDNGLRAGGYLGGGSTFASPDARKLSAVLAGANFAYQVRFEDIPQVPMLDIDLLPGGKADVALAFMSGNTKKPVMYLNGEVGVDMTFTYLNQEQLPDLSLSLTLPVKGKFGLIYDARGQAGKYTPVPAFKSGLGLRVSYQETYSVKIGYEVELSREYIRNGVVFSLQFSE